MTAPSSHVFPVVLLSLVVWRVYRRVRRNIGPQPLQPRRMIVRIVIFSVMILLSSVIAVMFPRIALGFAGGLVIGALLAVIGLQLTRFETKPEGRFYTPNTYIGVGLSVLLIVRVAYRLAVLSGSINAFDQRTQSQALMQSPLTLFIFGLLGSYYVAYYTGVLMRSRKLEGGSNQPAPERISGSTPPGPTNVP